MKYFMYVMRWAVLAVPGALFLNQFRYIFGINNIYISMIVSQAAMGAFVYFIDRAIFSPAKQ